MSDHLTKYFLIIMILTLVASGCSSHTSKYSPHLSDISRCDAEETEDRKQGCYQVTASVTNDPSICDDKMSNQEDRDTCYYMVTRENINNRDISICSEIKTQRMITECFMLFAIAERNPAVCDKIQNKDGRNYCNQQIAIVIGKK
ncbi:MAG: hypothetical protein U9Q92_04175 [archaeon]|nr:hypothetical protein [archaeon]